MRAMETNKNFQYLQECMDWVNNQLVSDILDITSGFQTLHGFCTLNFACCTQISGLFQNPDFFQIIFSSGLEPKTSNFWFFRHFWYEN